MGSEVCADELMDELNLSKKLISKVADEICGDSVESRIGTLVTQSSKLKDNQRTSIGPVTPESNRENVEQNHDWLSPPTVLSSPTRVPCSSSPDGNGRPLETPKDTLFDSFAPGPDKFMLAPQQRKYREESRSHIVRRLNFSCTTNLVRDFSDESGAETSSDEEKSSDEEQLFEIVYGTILDAILTEKTQEFISHDSDVEELRTPKSARVLSWGTETCPGAPMKKMSKFLEMPTKKRSKFRNIGKEICRKLEF